MDGARSRRVGRAERLLGRRFGDRQLLLRALTHRSSGPAHNERMEFLGDALLDAVIAEALYRRFPEEREGSLTAWRAALVNGRALAELMCERRLDQCLVLGPSVQRVADSPAVLANAFEALVAAVHLDSGFAACRDFVLDWYAERLLPERLHSLDADAKTRLQQSLQGLGARLPRYTVLDASAAAAGQHIAVRCDAELPGVGARRATASAGTRQEAEQRAAQTLLDLWKEAAPPEAQ